MLRRNKFLSIIIVVIPLSFLLSTADGVEKDQHHSVKESKKETEKIDIQKVSEAFGHLIRKNLDSIGVEFDMKQMIKGMEDAFAGKASPMNESECIQAISFVQEEAFQKQAQVNLSKADAFMANNAKNPAIVELEKNKLQYRIEKQGEGPVVEEHFSPMIHYTGKFLDGKVFGSSQEDERISLDETIQGFSQGIVGMKEGEKRTLYIHPDFGYGTSGYLPPNSTLVFEIEVVKANATPEQEDAFTSIPNEASREVALPERGPQETIR